MPAVIRSKDYAENEAALSETVCIKLMAAELPILQGVEAVRTALSAYSVMLTALRYYDDHREPTGPAAGAIGAPIAAVKLVAAKLLGVAVSELAS